MPLVEKQVLEAGAYCVDDQFWSFSQQDIDHYAEAGNAMLAAGIQIPVPLEHQKKARPVSPAELEAMEADERAAFARYNTGWVKNFSKHADGSLWASLDIQDEETFRKLPTTIQFCSPQIKPRFTDFTGRTYQDVITHLALTPQPIWHSQKPFVGTDGAALALSHLAAAPARPWGSTPDRPALAFSAYNAVRRDGETWKLNLAHEATMPTEPLEEEGYDEEEATESTTPEPEVGKPGASEGELRECIHCLAKLGVPLPEDTNAENFVKHLRLATHTLTNLPGEAEGEAQKPEEKPTNGPSESDMANAREEPQMVAMSQYQSVEEENAKLRKELATVRLGALMSDIDACAKGGLPPATVQGWKDALKTKELSLASRKPDGTVQRIRAEVAFAKKHLAMLSAWSPEERAYNLSHAETPEAPDYAKEKDGKEEVDVEIANRLSGGKYDAYKAKQNGKK